MLVFIIFTIIFLQESIQQESVTSCIEKSSERSGLCVNLKNCDYAVNLLKQRKIPEVCGFDRNDPLVCCPKTSSEILCYKYFKQQDVYISVFNGEKALSKEFPHMAVLGYGSNDDIQWLCGGSLISENFILTAAHCIKSKELGDVKRVRLGDLDIKNDKDDAQPQEFSVKRTFIHPEYQPHPHYHDIALIELDGNITVSDYVRPACLPSENINLNNFTDFIATGWGKTDFATEQSTHLLKVSLDLIQHKNCLKKYVNVSKRKLANGIVDDLQICAGHPDGNDSCQGDSGGPLQVIRYGYPNFFYIIGVTSFGKACGLEDSAGVYTRVSNYLDWIENIVWQT